MARHPLVRTLTILGLSASLFSNIFFALSPVFGKILLQSLTPPTLLAIGTLFSVLLVFFFFGIVNEFKKLKKIPTSHIFLLIIIGISSGVIAPLLSLWGLKMIQASDASLIGNISPIFLAILGIIFLKEKVSRNQIFGSIAMLIGVAFIATHGFSVPLKLSGGYVFIIAAGFFYSISDTIFKKYLHHISPELVIFIRNFIGSLVLFTVVPFLFGFSHDITPLSNKHILIFLCGYVFFGIFLGQLLWYKALDIISITINSVIALTYPIFGVFFAWLILDEKIMMYHFWGGTLIFGGLFLTLLHNRKYPHHHLLQRFKHGFHM